jgi:hypothetical protein
VAPERIRRGAATKLGVSLDEYDRRKAAGEFWCSGHQRWEPAAAVSSSRRGYCAETQRLRRRASQERQWQEFRNWVLARVLVK